MRITLAFLFLSALALAAPQNRVRDAVRDNKRVSLGGHLHPLAEVEDDLGEVPGTEALPLLTLNLHQTETQKADLEKLMAEQQDPSSPNYHHWLTPEEYGDRFGVSSSDLNKITVWLESHGLRVGTIGRARNWVSFNGTADQVSSAFGVRLHRLYVKGKQHFSNVSDPSIPAAFDGVIRGVHGLNDFKLQPRSVRHFTTSSGNHYLSPEDVAMVYNIKPLHSAGLRGAGQKIVIPGQTQIDLVDIQQFRSRFNLPASDPEVILVPNTKDPGKNLDDMGEADLDIQWAGATAPDAKIAYVYTSDVMNSVQYAIDQRVAPVLSLSYGLCESQTSRSDAMTFQAWARQANAQGMTWVTASGDSGGADCVTATSNSGAGLSVDVPSSIPEVTGVGGTEFNEGSGTYWANSNGANSLSALSYIPEAAWNDSAAKDPASGGGGVSVYFGKPAWQTGAGVPGDGARNVPDVSLNASADHGGYMVYSNGKLLVYGGTSAGAPALAGVLAILNQHLINTGAQAAAGLGNINPKLYSLAQTSPQAFHDVVTGNNIVTVTCTGRGRNCASGSYGYQAGPGYDMATGLGSIDAHALVTNWRGSAPSVTKGATQLTLTSSATTLSRSDSLTLQVSAVGLNGGVPQGSIIFNVGTFNLGSVLLNGAGVATLTISNSPLTTGANTIIASYGGDASYTAATASMIVSVSAASSANPIISGVANAASYRQSFAPGMLATVLGSDLSPITAVANAVPLAKQMGGVSATINGFAAALLYVSPNQVNLQIPYEVSTLTTATLNLNNNGRTTSFRIPISNAAPGIFTDTSAALVPKKTAARGQILEVYVTGAGQVSPSILTGSAPPAGATVGNLPRPLQALRVSVGGLDAPVVFSGIPSGLVGVVQLNVQVPFAAPLGSQQMTVTVGGVASAPASVSVSQF